MLPARRPDVAPGPTANSGALAEYVSLDPLRVRMQTHRIYSEVPDDVPARVLEHLPAGHLTGAKVVDVGCGSGAFLRRVGEERAPALMVGVDSSEAAAGQAALVSGCSGLVGDATRLPLRSGSVDVVTANHMLYHVADPAAALGEFARVLRPGGVVSVVVNDRDYLPKTTGLVSEVMCEHGTQAPGAMSVYSDDVGPIMQRFFTDVSTIHISNALVFDSPEPVINYCVAILGVLGLAPDAPAREAVEKALADRVHDWFVGEDEHWRDPKGYTVTVGRAT